jgi:hypothetical protein
MDDETGAKGTASDESQGPDTSAISPPAGHHGSTAGGGWVAVASRAQPVLVAALFLAIGAALTTPVSDPDFWWHLASGRWIWERGELMRADPFAFTAAAFPPPMQGSYPFTQYWLAELLMYGIHAGFGLTGVILLRAAVFTLMFFLLYRLMRGLGAGVLVAVPLVALADRAVVHELGYIGDRPQMWSSLFFVVTLLLCQRQREGRRAAFVLLPLLMLLWSNLHGGYLLGLAVVGVSAAADLITGRSTRPSRASAGAAFLLSGCNPAGFSVLLSYPATRIFGFVALPGITEEHSLLSWISFSSSPRLIPALTSVLVLSLITILPRLRTMARERPDLLGLYLITLAMGALAARFVIFFVAVAAALTAANAAALLQQRWVPVAGRLAGNRGHASLATATALVLVALTAQQAGVAARTSALRPGAEFHHPYEGIADFLGKSGLSGNLFNEYRAGGYLTWRLFPSMKVFIYGRMLSGDLLGLYQDLLLSPSAAKEGRPRYQEELDARQIDTLVLPTCNTTSGLILPLAVVVARDENWALVYSDAAAVVLVRKSRAPAHLLAGAPPPTALYDNMIAIAENTGRTRHGQAMPAWRYSLAFALYAKGEREPALAVLDEYLRRAPGHEAARRVRERIRGEIEAAGMPTSPDRTDEEAPGPHERNNFRGRSVPAAP